REYHLDYYPHWLYLLRMEMEIEKTYIPHLYPEYKHLSPEEIDAQYTEVYDRWTWDTGTDEDRALLEKLDIERHHRKNNKAQKLKARWTVESQQTLVSEISEELVNEMAEEITKEIDAEILRTIKPI
ncbi:unnamed protein product, partial [marine sediment metagenome]